jgi:hypothetical protein
VSSHQREIEGNVRGVTLEPWDKGAMTAAWSVCSRRCSTSAHSPADARPYYSPLIMRRRARACRSRTVAAPDPIYEHGIVLMSGECALDGEPLARRMVAGIVLRGTRL